MLQISRFSAFAITELLKENQEWGKIPSPSPRLTLKCPEILKRVEGGNANSQHKQIFVKHLCRVSSGILQTYFDSLAFAV